MEGRSVGKLGELTTPDWPRARIFFLNW
jgi:hypothetical protein